MAKATEAVKTLKSSREEPSGIGRAGCCESRRWNTCACGPVQAGEVLSGRWPTSTVTNGISRRGEVQENAGGEVGRGYSTDDERANITRSEGRGAPSTK